MYEKGRGVEQSDEQAVGWLIKATHHDNANVEFSNGNEAVLLLVKLADQKSNVRAQYTLGRMYHEGQGGVAQNNKQAVYWWNKAANQNHAIAQFSLGRMYYQGLGVAQSDEQAVLWWARAANQNHTFAQFN